MKRLKVYSISFFYVALQLLFLPHSNSELRSQNFSEITFLSEVPTSIPSESKPQSKVWNYGGYWWAVIPTSSGTHLYRLDGNTWTNTNLLIHSSTNRRVDVLQDGNLTHILLHVKDGTLAFIKTIEFVSGSPPFYQNWNSNSSGTSVNLGSVTEAATLAIDSNDRLWIGYDGQAAGDTLIRVKYSDSPYSSWSASQTVFSGIRVDDICAITSFGGDKIGIMWSNQASKNFGFAYRIDGSQDTTWNREIAASTPVGAPGDGIADDHINFAVDDDGTIYAAVKCAYDTPGWPTIGLLVRSSAGTWSSLYELTSGTSSSGTRPIVILNDRDDILTVLYAKKNNGDDILYQQSATNSINFTGNERLLTHSDFEYDDITSTKQNFSDEIVFLFARDLSSGPIDYRWTGVKVSANEVYTDNGAGFSLTFDGFDDIVKGGSSSAYNVNSEVTIEAWIKPNALKDQTIVEKRNILQAEGYGLSLTQSGKIQFTINSTVLNSNYTYPSNGTEWFHIAAVSTSGQMIIYVNGVLDATTTSAAINNYTGSFNIGGESDETNFFNGEMDEIRVWSVARSENEIRTYMCRTFDTPPSDIKGYWKMDNVTGLEAEDLDNLDKPGRLFNFYETKYDWSGADLGDESAFNYTGSSYSASLSHSDGDDITATTTSGSIQGIQVYRVDANSVRDGSTVPSGYTLSPERYWGVKVIGANPEYTVTYNYEGHPGIVNENSLKLVKRNNLADNSWIDAGATLNTTSNTLEKTEETGTQYTLASTTDPLPVELSSFTGVFINGKVKLTWRTETEVSNYGFEIQKSEISGQSLENWVKIGFVEGSGNSNSPKIYTFLDDVENNSGVFYYRLKQIDTDGTFTFSDIIEVNSGELTEFNLEQNYPNPFNPSTKIRFTIPSVNENDMTQSLVTLKVYDILGNEVTELVNEIKPPGNYEIEFTGDQLSSGVYFYQLRAADYFQTRKMIISK